VEGRVPFLDHKLVELVNGFPLHTKLTPQLREKHILREAVKPFITQEVYERQKHPFLSPPATMNRKNPLYQLMQDTLRSEDMKNVKLFDHAKVLELLDHLHADNLPKDVGRQMKLDVKLNQLLGFCFLQKHFNPTVQSD
jgi:asparagine synthase (glutamine-hydrolysing)